eukprot:8341472-Alexandrium_andersonii.AAC.1
MVQARSAPLLRAGPRPANGASGRKEFCTTARMPYVWKALRSSSSPPSLRCMSIPKKPTARSTRVRISWSAMATAWVATNA